VVTGSSARSLTNAPHGGDSVHDHLRSPPALILVGVVEVAAAALFDDGWAESGSAGTNAPAPTRTVPLGRAEHSGARSQERLAGNQDHVNRRGHCFATPRSSLRVLSVRKLASRNATTAQTDTSTRSTRGSLAFPGQRHPLAGPMRCGRRTPRVQGAAGVDAASAAAPVMPWLRPALELPYRIRRFSVDRPTLPR
jgi:hypothetical protein